MPVRSSTRSSEALVAHAKKLLRSMRGKRALLVGDFVLDAYVFGQTERISREAPVPIVRRERAELRLGAAANTAANLAALGLSVRLVGCVGDDAAGAQLRQMLEGLGCEASSLRRCRQAPTPTKTRILAGAFGLAQQQVLRLDAGGENPWPNSHQDALAAALRRHGENVDVIVVSDYGHGTLGAPAIHVLCELAKKGARVCVDSRHNLAAFVGMTALTPNLPEAEALVGTPLASKDSVQRAGAHVLEQLRCQACLITQGRRGMTLFRPAVAPAHVDIVGKGEVADVTGAGDTVLAAFSAALAACLGWRAAAFLANCAAGVVVSRLGTACATVAEIAHLAATSPAAPQALGDNAC